jgi:drug/metabolite transporter (DMT)-like permease
VTDIDKHRDGVFVRAMPGLFVLLWATGFIGAKFGLPYAPPLKFLLWRFAVVIVLMTAVALATRAAWPRGTQFGHVAVAGVLLQAGYLGGVFVSIDLGMSAGVSALIVSLQPILTASYASTSASTLGERVSPRQWAGFMLGLGGVALVVSGKLGMGGFGWGAFGAALVGLLSITAGTLYQKRFCGAQDLRTQSVVQFVAAGLVLLPLSLAFETRAVEWTGSFVFALGWLVLVLSFGAISVLLLLIRRGAATRVSSLMYLVPPVTALVAWMLFDEQLTTSAFAGMALAAAGVALVVRAPTAGR